MIIDNVLAKMTYSDDHEMQQAKKYINLKGIAQHQRIINYLNVEKPTYKEVSDLYKYDKRLRNILYIYIATVEEFLRAIIGNIYEDKFNNLNKSKAFLKKFKSIKSVSFTLEQLTLGQLIEVIILNSKDFENLYDLVHLEENLQALRILRNKVSHNNFLLSEKYNYCFVNDIKANSLQHNIENLKSFLPEDFRNGFTCDIYKCSKGLSAGYLGEL